MPNGDSEDRVLGLANFVAGRHGMWLRTDAEKYLRVRLQMAESEQLLRDEAGWARAELAVARWIEASVQYAEDEPRGEPELRQDDLEQTLAGLCPGFWPFC